MSTDWHIEHSKNDEGSEFATLFVTEADGTKWEHHFARWIDSGPMESALEQATSFAQAMREVEEHGLEALLAPFGPEWEREQSERSDWD